jgi:hypothetical protein
MTREHLFSVPTLLVLFTTLGVTQSAQPTGGTINVSVVNDVSGPGVPAAHVSVAVVATTRRPNAKGLEIVAQGETDEEGRVSFGPVVFKDGVKDGVTYGYEVAKDGVRLRSHALKITGQTPESVSVEVRVR